MERICLACAKEPNAHSFRKISDKKVTVYMTQPARATAYEDTDGILEHVKNVLKFQGSKPWKLVIDGTGFELKHAIHIKTGTGIVELLNQYGDFLQDIIIINPTIYINGAISYAKSILKEELYNKVQVKEDRIYSVIEFMT